MRGASAIGDLVEMGPYAARNAMPLRVSRRDRWGDDFFDIRSRPDSGVFESLDPGVKFKQKSPGRPPCSGANDHCAGTVRHQYLKTSARTPAISLDSTSGTIVMRIKVSRNQLVRRPAICLPALSAWRPALARIALPTI